MIYEIKAKYQSKVRKNRGEGDIQCIWLFPTWYLYSKPFLCELSKSFLIKTWILWSNKQDQRVVTKLYSMSNRPHPASVWILIFAGQTDMILSNIKHESVWMVFKKNFLRVMTLRLRTNIVKSNRNRSSAKSINEVIPPKYRSVFSRKSLRF